MNKGNILWATPAYGMYQLKVYLKPIVKTKLFFSEKGVIFKKGKSSFKFLI